MLLTFIIDPPFLLFLGFLFALAIPLTSRRPLVRTRAYHAGLATLIVFCLAVTISFLWYPDWMWMYYATVSSAPFAARGLHLLLGLLAYFLLYCVGFLLGARAKVRGKCAIWTGLILFGAASVLIILPFFDRYYHVGTTAEFLAGTAVPLPESPLALVYNITIPVVTIAGLIGFLVARKER